MSLTAEKIAELRAEAERAAADSSATLVYTIMLEPQDLLALLDEITALRAALVAAPRAVPEYFDIIAYIDWYFSEPVRSARAALEAKP